MQEVEMELKSKLVILFAILAGGAIAFGICYRIYDVNRTWNANSITTICLVLNRSSVVATCPETQKRDNGCSTGNVTVRYGANYIGSKPVITSFDSVVSSYLNEHYPIGLQFKCWYDKDKVSDVHFEYYDPQVPLVIGIVIIVAIVVALLIWGLYEFISYRRCGYQAY
jgi:hypothetical protein